ncbi:CBS domain-containing protein [Desulfatibacillum aliphaticivorans]|uniref:CBS domain-containing protein n=1 Tax=Desulfatibacillum aliphaticivorans TaxID=218208 RepID=UPI0003FD7F59|nr:CBS domain-containing protein [Desulfatibacillum aliphaticivorans]
MLVKDVMTANVVTITSDTSLADAKRIMEAHKFQRLPVVDKGKLKGVVTEKRLEKVSPSEATSLTVWEVGYLLEKTPVSKIMAKNVVTVTPEMTVEEGLALAQTNKVGALVVIEAGKVIGIVTTNDFFYKIANKVLGIGEPGTRIFILRGGEGPELEKILGHVNKHQMKIVTIHVLSPPDQEKHDVVVHVTSKDVKALLKDLRADGFKVATRSR